VEPKSPIKGTDSRYTVDSYFGLVHTGELSEDDRVELLEGLIVAKEPQNPPHASGAARVAEALRDVLGKAAVIRVQFPFIAGPYSAPEPDVAVVPGQLADYDERHPNTALLIVEVADSSLPQDRLSKSRIYAAAAVPEYWIVNVRDGCVEVFRIPDTATRCYTDKCTKHRGERLALVALPDASVSVDDLLPRRGAANP